MASPKLGQSNSKLEIRLVLTLCEIHPRALGDMTKNYDYCSSDNLGTYVEPHLVLVQDVLGIFSLLPSNY